MPRTRTSVRTADQAGDDVRVDDPAKVSGAGWEGEVSVSDLLGVYMARYRIILG